MATYSGVYQTDYLNKSFLSIALECYFISNNNKVASSVETDEDYLPGVFIDNTTIDKALCQPPGRFRLRYTRIIISETLSFYVPCPFVGGSNEFITFFREIKAKTPNFVIELLPERIPPYLLNVWV